MSAVLRGVHGIKSVLITESAAIRIDSNLARVYYFTHTTEGPCDSPNPLKLDKGVLASTVPNNAQPAKFFLYIVPLGDPLSLPA